jgi:hypothetical protein
MPKKYSDRQMSAQPEEREYTFPKFGVVVKAASIEEAEEKLSALLKGEVTS